MGIKSRYEKTTTFCKALLENWSTADDLRSLARWEQLFGSNFHGLFVFAYDVLGDRAPLPAEELFQRRGKLYGFVAVPLSAYLGHARMISPRWDTLAMPTAKFRHYARPLGELLGQNSLNAECGMMQDECKLPEIINCDPVDEADF